MQYAPDRNVEIKQLALDVTPNFEKRSVSGSATFTFAPIGKPLQELTLDGIDLTVHDIKSSIPLKGFDVTDEKIVITFKDPIEVGQENKVFVRYSATPQYGLYFRAPSNGYTKEDMHVFSQGEMIEARHWFPCHDYPNSKFKTDVTCHVPTGMAVLSNGKMVSQKQDAEGLTEIKWSQDKPHVNYLISLVAGNFSHLTDQSTSVPLSFYTLPSDEKYAQSAFAPTPKALSFFEKEIGVPYPWVQYGQVVVHGFTQTGMENTTLTTLNESVLYPEDSESIYAYGGVYNDLGYMSEVLVSHELAHQWFGDLVTCRDWSHAWLNEGFATYYSILFAGNQHGKDEMLYCLYGDLQLIQSSSSDQRPIANKRYAEPVEQFSYNRAYAKASWVVHMLRSQLGEELFRRCVKTYLEKHKYQTVVTQDLISIVEDLSGRSFDRFFDQWIFSSPIPELAVNYEWDESEKLAKVSISQQQKSGDKIAKMRFPLKLRFKTKSGILDKDVEIREIEEDFYVSLESAPDIVRIDPEFNLLANIIFKPSTTMLYSQLADKDDSVGRLLAAEQLSGRADETTIKKLKLCLARDSFYGVRAKAADTLKNIHNEEALDALIASTNQSDARARLAVVKNIGGFFNPKAMLALMTCLKIEKNSAIQCAILTGLSAYNDPQVKQSFLEYLQKKSYQNRLAEAAISAMKRQEDPVFAQPIKEMLIKQGADATSRTINASLDAIAFLSRHEQKKKEVRDFIATYLTHNRTQVQCGAIQALGTLEDASAIPLLETFAWSSTKNPQQKDAQRAIRSLRSVNVPSDNLKDLRTQLLDLQKSQRDLKKEVDDLRKRLKVTEPETGSKRATKQAPHEDKKSSNTVLRGKTVSTPQDKKSSEHTSVHGRIKTGGH